LTRINSPNNLIDLELFCKEEWEKRKIKMLKHIQQTSPHYPPATCPLNTLLKNAVSVDTPGSTNDNKNKLGQPTPRNITVFQQITVKKDLGVEFSAQMRRREGLPSLHFV